MGRRIRISYATIKSFVAATTPTEHCNATQTQCMGSGVKNGSNVIIAKNKNKNILKFYWKIFYKRYFLCMK